MATHYGASKYIRRIEVGTDEYPNMAAGDVVVLACSVSKVTKLGKTIILDVEPCPMADTAPLGLD